MLLAAVLLAACSDAPSTTGTGAEFPASGDPGSGPWQPVAAERVAADCGLDPDLLAAADAAIARPYAIVRYGRLCHELYPDGGDAPGEVFSATKTLGATVTGIAAFETRDLERNGRKTGPLSDADRVDHWLDSFSFNPDAQVAHVLGMVAHDPDLTPGARTFLYDADGSREINRLSDVLNTVVAQDPERLGANLEEFTQRFLFAPLGMHDSRWSGGRPDKVFAFSWSSTVRDMARLGLLLLHGGRWNGEQLLDPAWVQRMTHPSFEDANTGYGYLTWLDSSSGWTFSVRKNEGPLDACAPDAIHPLFPHGIAGTTDCGYAPPYACEQQHDVGVWYAFGLFGQYIVGHRGLDLVLVVKNFGDLDGPKRLWDAVRPALVAEDPEFRGDEAAFCAAYGAGAYAPDLPDA